MKTFKRNLTDILKKWMNRKEILAIKGPRQSGKTTLLHILKEWLIQEKKVLPENIIFLTFEDREILEKFSFDPKRFVKSFIKSDTKLYFFIDEFQYLDNGGQKLKLLYDIYPGIKFIITGSSSLELADSTGKFLVGRMFSFHLWQFSFEEFIAAKSFQMENVYREIKDSVNSFILKGKDFSAPHTDIFSGDFGKLFEEYALWGGYPEIIKAENEETRRIILKNIYDTYITKDIIELLKITDYARLRTLLISLANNIGGLLNYNELCLTANSYFKEVKQHLSILQETFIINLLRPFYRNRATELKKNPKPYFVDTGLRNYIIGNFGELFTRPDAGKIVENFVLTQLMIQKNEDYQIKFWRTLNKAEVDFVLEKDSVLIPAEVKYSEMRSPQISRSFRNFIIQYNPETAIILTKNYWGSLTVDKTKIKFIPVWFI